MAAAIDIVVEPERCSGCGTCVTFCPYQAVSLELGVAVIEPSCARCTACVSICPAQALSIRRAVPLTQRSEEEAA